MQIEAGMGGPEVRAVASPPVILLLHHRYRHTGGEERAVQDLAWLIREHLGEDAEILERDSAGGGRGAAAPGGGAGGPRPGGGAGAGPRAGGRGRAPRHTAPPV